MKEIKKKVLYIFPFLFVIFLIGLLVFSFYSKPRVMVVMSYSDEDLWEKQVRLALDKTFRENAPYFAINYYYLNIRNNNVPAYIERVTKEVHDLILKWKPDVLLLIDDDAQHYVGKKYLYNPNYNIVFAGVNTEPANYGYIRHQNVTGIEENLHLHAMNNAINEIFPGYHKIIHLSDDTTTARFVAEKIRNYDWSSLEVIGTHQTNSIVEWEKIIDQANSLNAILLLSHFQTITLDKTPISPRDVGQFILQRAKVPVMGLFNFNVVWGVPFAISTSALEQGEIAAKLTIKILKDKVKVGDIPFAHSTYFSFTYNKKSMDINMPGLNLPPIYKSFSYLNSMFENAVYQSN